MRKLCIPLAFLLVCAVLLCACAGAPGTAEDFASRSLVRAAALKGPTGMGMAGLMQANEEQASANRYEFTLASAPDEIVAALSSGSVDVAAIPTNLAATLYQKTQGQVKIVAINTLGVLYILERGDSVQTLADLSGRTLYASAQGSMTEFALRYVLEQGGVDAQVEFYTDHAELAALAAAGEADLVLLPEPFVTTLRAQAPDMRVALDLTQEWEKVAANPGAAALPMGCLVARTAYLEENQEAFAAFIEDYRKSVSLAQQDIPAAAELIAKFEILPSAQVAQQALPGCNIVLLTGDEMKSAASTLYEVLFAMEPKAIGGAMPDEDFYYVK